jgi:hypothetical protein
MVEYVSARNGGGLNFNATNANAKGSLDLTALSAAPLKIGTLDPMTIAFMCYINPTDLYGARTLLSTRSDTEPDGYIVFVSAGVIGYLFSNGLWGAGNNSRIAITAPAKGGLSHVAITKDASVSAALCDVYVDGAVTAKTITNDVLNSATATVYEPVLMLGREPITTAPSTSPAIYYDLQIYNAKLTAAEIAKLSVGNIPPKNRRVVYKSGIITASTGSPTVTGVGTKFTSELMVGNAIYRGVNRLGFVNSITSDTQLTLKANALYNVSGFDYQAGNLVGHWDFETGSGNTVFDKTQFGNNFILSSMTTTLGSSNQWVNEFGQPKLVA